MRPCAVLDEWIAFTGQFHLVGRGVNETHADAVIQPPVDGRRIEMRSSPLLVKQLVRCTDDRLGRSPQPFVTRSRI